MEQKNNSNAWYEKTWAVILLCIVFFPVGLYALWKNSTIGKGWKIGVTALIVIIVIAQIGNEDSTSASKDSERESESKGPTGVGVGEVLHTDYFDIKVNKVNLVDRVNTGNEFANLNPEPGVSYIIINASFKNTDTESRMLMDGSVWINYNGKNYEFDHAETVMLEGWGLIFDQINPLTIKTTNLVYKIPTEIKGDAYWQPGRAENDQKIFLGRLE